MERKGGRKEGRKSMSKQSKRRKENAEAWGSERQRRRRAELSSLPGVHALPLPLPFYHQIFLRRVFPKLPVLAARFRIHRSSDLPTALQAWIMTYRLFFPSWGFGADWGVAKACLVVRPFLKARTVWSLAPCCWEQWHSCPGWQGPPGVWKLPEALFGSCQSTWSPLGIRISGFLLFPPAP